MKRTVLSFLLLIAGLPMLAYGALICPHEEVITIQCPALSSYAPCAGQDVGGCAGLNPPNAGAQNPNTGLWGAGVANNKHRQVGAGNQTRICYVTSYCQWVNGACQIRANTETNHVRAEDVTVNCP